MPYKCEKLHIPKEKDRRRKLTDQEKIEIKGLYGQISQRKLAKAYGVSRRLITFIGDPEKLKANLERREERGGSRIYYVKERYAKVMKKHRRWKQQLYLKGELEE